VVKPLRFFIVFCRRILNESSSWRSGQDQQAGSLCSPIQEIRDIRSLPSVASAKESNQLFSAVSCYEFILEQENYNS